MAQLSAPGLAFVPDGTLTYAGAPVVGVRLADAGAMLIDSALGAWSGQPVLGVVEIDDGRTRYNGLDVVAISGISADPWADGPAPDGFHWEFVFDDATGTVVKDDATGEPHVALVED